MNKLANILLLTALALPMSAYAQPGERGPGNRPDRDGPPHQRDQRPGERGERPDRGEHNRDAPRRGEPIPVEMIDEAIATLRELHPEMKPGWLEQIEKLAEEKPEEAAKRLARFPRIREMMDARKNRPAEFELHSKQSKLMREVFRLVREFHNAKEQGDQAKMDELQPQIRERFETLFQIRLKMKEIEIQRMREKIKHAEEELQKIESESDALIDQKMKEMMERAPKSPREGEGDKPRPNRPDRQRPDQKPDREAAPE